MLAFSSICFGISVAIAQPAEDFPPPNGPGPGFGPRFGPPQQEKIRLVEKFDKNGDKILQPDERKEALQFLEKERANRPRRGPGPGGPGGRPGFGPRGDESAAAPGKKLAPADIQAFPDASLYDPAVLRTIFIQFENDNWEKEMAAFKNTDVEMPARIIVDGKSYSDVGVHFRGMSSFMMVGEGRKRSLNLSFDFKNKDQNLHGYRTLELLNSHEDPSFLRTVLSYQIEREYVPAPKANFVRVVINGESWGVYANTQAFNKDFVRDWYGTTKGARWKAPGSPQGRASLKYLGDNVEKYKGIYDLKSKEDAKAWADLIRLCKVLTETPADQLEAALSPILDIDGALKFLALENALINNDGYWIRTSDYSIYQDTKGVFHILPHDSNETFSRPESPGGPGGPRGFGMRGFGGGLPGQPPGDRLEGNRPPNEEQGRPRGEGGPGRGLNIKGVELDPLFAANDENKPLISKLLAVPALRERYLNYVRDIADKWLDWQKLGPIARQYHVLIANDVRDDTRKLDTTDAFLKSMIEDIPGNNRPGPGGRGTIGIKSFADQRREFLLTKLKK